ncbi:hypothetical protein C2740_05745 [Polynucleobacter sp. MG-5-Ahmo-C2]|uniref:flagellin n=1 Tax=Polynucleobacter sp. MG-5-Ahmo-C2 TaxID=2081051 RepID=UPI001BFE4F28|nr:hypothetical protein [Polynucleobacter sp. MG-5-Ahmo-C2]QWD97868.1 hypothetical protein C2740_05745 [Polynucleobacter sp. MG-5-Ahmo-C2]
MFTFSPLQITLASAVSSVQQQIIDTQNQLSSGKRSLNAGESGIVTRLSSQAASYDTAVKNITAAKNVISVGQSALASMAAIVQTMESLATQASSAGTNGGTDIDSMDTTFTNLYTQLTTIANAASVNGNSVLQSLTTGTDLKVTYDDTATIRSLIPQQDILGLSSSATSGLEYYAALKIADTWDGTTLLGGALGTDAATCLTQLKSFMSDISTAQGNLTAYSATMDALSSSASSISQGLNSTVDNIQNVDSTALQAKLQSLNNQQSIDYYLVSQMNTESAAILAIFR